MKTWKMPKLVKESNQKEKPALFSLGKATGRKGERLTTTSYTFPIACLVWQNRILDLASRGIRPVLLPAKPTFNQAK